MGRSLLHLDAFAGIAGDMLLAALLDAGASEAAVRDALARLDLPGWELAVAPRHVAGLRALDVRVTVEAPATAGGRRSWATIRALLEAAGLPPEARDLALAVFGRLAEAEGSVHGVDPDDVHFHEVGAVDSIVDIVGGAVALAELAPGRVTCRPLPLGSGFVKTAHGRLPLPAPATLALLAGAPTRPAGIEGELVTPTGAAFVATIVDEFVEWPAFVPAAIGYGAGDRSLPDRPNLLRVVLGESTPTPATEVVEVGANIDDMTPEAHGFLQEALFEAGALDAWFVSIQMKKGRPAVGVWALCEPARTEEVVAAFLRHSSTLGVRCRGVSRRCLPREVRTVETPYGPVRLKVARLDGGERVSVEYDDCAAAARAAGVTLEEVRAAALAAPE